nr:hypothetical protein [Rhizobium sp. T1473]
MRGFRIEPGEIAARLCEHELVGDAVVVARADRTGDQRLVAYVVAKPAHGSDEADCAQLAASLRAHLGSLLPDYMVPPISCGWRGGRWPRTVTSSARCCPPPSTMPSRGPSRTRRTARSRASGRRAAKSCAVSAGSAATTTSSSSAATRSWRCS